MGDVKFGTFILLFTTDWLSWQQAIKVQHASIPLEDARRAQIRVQHWGGQLNIGAHCASQDLLQGVFNGGLDRKISRSGEVIDVLLNIENPPGFMNLKLPWAWWQTNLVDWSFSLRQQIPIAVDILSASERAKLELSDLQITELNLATNATSMLISLPAHAGQTSVNIRASNLSLTLRVPPEVAACIQTSRALTRSEIDLTRFPITGHASEYRSATYEIAANRATSTWISPAARWRLFRRIQEHLHLVQGLYPIFEIPQQVFVEKLPIVSFLRDGPGFLDDLTRVNLDEGLASASNRIFL